MTQQPSTSLSLCLTAKRNHPRWMDVGARKPLPSHALLATPEGMYPLSNTQTYSFHWPAQCIFKLQLIRITSPLIKPSFKPLHSKFDDTDPALHATCFKLQTNF
uniref:Ovule protein n=1 Tax=Panagrellus redivivus TaxID=6233 RepID=A0A7E4UUA3_PANRE